MDDLDVKELLATAARGRPAELHPVHAVLRRRRRTRITVAGVAAGTLVLASVATFLVDPGVVVDGVAPAATVTLEPDEPRPSARTTADPAQLEAASLAIGAVVADTFPGWPSGDAGESRWEGQPGESRLIGWDWGATDQRSELPVSLSVRVEHYPQLPAGFDTPCLGDEPAACTETVTADGTSVASGYRVGSVSQERDGTTGTATISYPWARSVAPDGRVVEVMTYVSGPQDRLLHAGDTFPADSPVTSSSLAALVSDPRLAEVPLP